MSRIPLLAVTMGDPAGVGPEICLKATRDHQGDRQALVLFGDADVLSRFTRQADLPLSMVASTLDQAIVNARSSGSSILHIPSLEGDWKPGFVTAKTGGATYRYITTAIDAALAGHVDAVVTGPIHKEALRLSGVEYPGHTEIFEALTRADRACMMLKSDALTCSFVTTHVGLCDVPELISTQRVLDVIELTDQAMRRVHDHAPRLVVCGLNPHAGESGLFGNGEEERCIIPAIEAARAKGMQVEGPLPPDTAFLPARRRQTDAFVCMYHDQGHIPLKALSFETAVNVTLGLPIIRTSVDHGTALDIAWKQFNADPTSMLQAISLAGQLCEGDFRSPNATELSRDKAAESRRHGDEVTL